MTQCQRVLDYMVNRGSISTMEAYSIGVTSFHRRMSDLKKKGYIFGIERCNDTDRYGKPTTFNQYSLIGKENNA